MTQPPTAVKIDTDVGTLELIDESCHSSCSTGNVHGYPFASCSTTTGTGGSRPSSLHGVLLDGAPLAVLGRGGGQSCVHAHSLLYADGLLYVAVGDGVA
jgi:hypothetical protein